MQYSSDPQDQAAVIRRTAKFLGRTVTAEQVAVLEKHLEFSKMAANPAINLEGILKKNDTDPNVKFIRKGKVGDWRNYMSDDLSRRFDEWSTKNLQGTGLKFNYIDFKN